MPAAPPDPPPLRVAAIVLAGGAGRRFGGGKLLAPFRGRPLIAHAVAAARASLAAEVLVVTGCDAAAISQAIGPGIAFVHAPDWAEGIAASLRAGLAALPPSAEAALICLGDMPLVTPGIIDRLILAARPGRVTVPVHRGRRGNPVLWPRTQFARLAALTGDAGGRAALAADPALACEVPVESEAVLLDADTPQGLSALETAVTV